jgi:acetate kinase
MGTRSGDVDPGLHTFLHNELGMAIGDIDTLLNKQSGLKGMAGVNDFRELEDRRAAGDEAAQLAFDVYVHRLKHYLGAYLAHLGRLDVLSFTAGVGENNPAMRAAVVDGLGDLGFAIDPALNNVRSKVARVISSDGAPITIAVVPTNEELAIARETAALLESRTD